MKSIAAILVLFGISQVYSSIVPTTGVAALAGPGTLGAVVRGPTAQATITGPDGSIVSGVADAGALAARPVPGGVVSAAIAPGIVSGGIAVPRVAISPAIAAPGIIAPGIGGAVLAGPSGTVIARNGLGLGLGVLALAWEYQVSSRE
ncbi:protein c21orf59 [Holotrichia oblita]|uniref:Protein c21orf59 n=1 Tax=Holotrichia oblita TaxID=644536 RepID=A0ACB9T7F7_HOLOL|nr:protein c21orf59 [Holotrichia oblita]